MKRSTFQKRLLADRAVIQDAPDWPQWLTRLAFVLMLAIVIARATITESIREPFDAAPDAPSLPGTPGPAAGMVLDLLALLPALLVLLRRTVDRAFALHLTWSHA